MLLRALADSIAQDLRYSIRSLAANRAFAGLSVLCLTLAIGTNATVFTFVNALLLGPLPVAAPEQLVIVQEARRDDPASAGPASHANFLDWQDRLGDVADLAAMRPVALRVSDGGAPDRYSGALVSANLFPLLGVPTWRGRNFAPGEERAVLLSHSLWQQRYAADAAIIGRSITINGAAHTVVGVLPAAVSDPAMQSVLRGARLWLPFGSAERQSRRDDRRLTVFGRLRAGTTIEAARERVRAIAQTLEDQYRSANGGWSAAVQPLRVGFSPTTRTLLLLMMGAVSFVLLIACANVANLTLARATGRLHEIAMRLALGASRGRIVRQLLTESLIVAAASVPLGVLLAVWGRGLVLGTTVSPELSAAIDIDGRVLAFTAGLAVAASVVSGLVPALMAVRRLDQNVLASRGRREAAASPVHARLSRALLVAEVALSLILLVGASLFVQSFRHLLAADGGFDTSSILLASVETTSDDGPPSARDRQRVHELVDRLQGVAGAGAVAAANLTPLRNGGVRGSVVLEGSADTSTILLGGITSEFFTVLNVPIRQGRGFSDVEGRSRSAVAIVNQAFASRFWPNQDAIGKRFRRADSDDGWFTTIGVAADILTWDLSNRPLPTAYLPYVYVPASEPRLLMRSAGDPALLAPVARAAVQAVDPTMPVIDIRTMTEIHYLALSRQQTFAALLSVLGGIALILGATGVYGVFSYFVSQRRYEIGVRAALGADRRLLVTLFLKQGLTVTLLGVLVGCAGAWALARVLRGQLRDVSPTDPMTFAAVSLLLIGVAVIATYVPARRAATVDPLIAIRE